MAGLDSIADFVGQEGHVWLTCKATNPSWVCLKSRLGAWRYQINLHTKINGSFWMIELERHTSFGSRQTASPGNPVQSNQLDDNFKSLLFTFFCCFSLRSPPSPTPAEHWLVKIGTVAWASRLCSPFTNRRSTTSPIPPYAWLYWYLLTSRSMSTCSRVR